MNANNNATKPLEDNSVSSENLPEEIHSNVSVQPCEFELLLQGAMEILNVRARTATASQS